MDIIILSSTDSGDKTDKSSPTQLPTNLDPCSR